MAGKPGFGITRIIDRIMKKGGEGKRDDRRRLTLTASSVRAWAAIEERAQGS
jgi:hypothetical protein